MSFRWRVSLAIVLALMLALLAQFGLGFVLFRQALAADLQRDVARYTTLLVPELTIGADEPTLSQQGRAALRGLYSYADGRVRVIDEGGRQQLAVGRPFPSDLSGWVVRRVQLERGHVLEVAMSSRVHNRALRDYLQANALGLPLLVLCLGVFGLWLARRLLLPLKALQETVTRVARAADLRARVTEPAVDDELSRLARGYNAMMVRLEGAFERERTFTRYASHELRNPVAALRLQVDAALKGDLNVTQVLPTLKAELARLSDTLDGLLILAREGRAGATPLDLAEVVQSSVDRGRLLAGGTLIDYSGPASLAFEGDPALLARLVDNLIENAVKYGRGGWLGATLEATSTALVLRVEDEGPGVPLEVLERLTEPFYRVPGSHERGQDAPGVGLGLAVVARVARWHRGTVAFSNRSPQGFCAAVSFPRQPAS